MSTGRLRSNGVVRKCSSMAWKPASSSAKRSGPIGEHRREADRGVHRVAAADPVPEAEHVRGVDAELARPRRRSSRRPRSASRPRLVAERSERPGAGRVRVRHRLERREGLRRDDEERLVGRRGRAWPRRSRSSRRSRRSGTSGRVACSGAAPRTPSPARGRSRRCRCSRRCGSACRCGPSTRPSGCAPRTPPCGRAPRAPPRRRRRRRRRASARVACAARHGGRSGSRSS